MSCCAMRASFPFVDRNFRSSLIGTRTEAVDAVATDQKFCSRRQPFVVSRPTPAQGMLHDEIETGSGYH